MGLIQEYDCLNDKGKIAKLGMKLKYKNVQLYWEPESTKVQKYLV